MVVCLESLPDMAVDRLDVPSLDRNPRPSFLLDLKKKIVNTVFKWTHKSTTSYAMLDFESDIEKF